MLLKIISGILNGKGREEEKKNQFSEANPLILLLSPYAIRQGRGGWRGWLSAGVRAALSWQAAPDGSCQG